VARLPTLSGSKLLEALKKDGFAIVKQKGSHVSLQKGVYRTVVPLHKELAKGTLLAILKQCGLSKDDLLHLLEK
jgi:predicted RNA binding protein YcfA (HicA-like mRNA interferase family)